MEEQYNTAIHKALHYLDDRGWTELIDPRWTLDVREELERSGLGFTEDEIVELCNMIFNGEPDWNTTERLSINDWPSQ